VLPATDAMRIGGMTRRGGTCARYRRLRHDTFNAARMPPSVSCTEGGRSEDPSDLLLRLLHPHLQTLQTSVQEQQVSLFREQGASDPPRGAPAAHGLPTNKNLQPLKSFVQMDPHQSGDQPQQHQFASGYISTRPNPEAHPPAQEGDNWTVVQHHSTAGKRAAHERARTTSESGRSPAANRTRHYHPAQVHFQTMAQQNPYAPLAAQAHQPTSQEWWHANRSRG